MNRAPIIAIAASLLAAACAQPADGDAGSGAAGGETPATSVGNNSETAVQAEPGSSGNLFFLSPEEDAINACRLLTADEVSEAFGGAALSQGGRPSPKQAGGVYSAQCRWESATPDKNFQLWIEINFSDAEETARQWLSAHKPQSPTPGGGPAIAIAGIGDEAIEAEAGLFARSGQFFFTFIVQPDDEPSREAAKKLAPLAIRRLEAIATETGSASGLLNAPRNFKVVDPCSLVRENEFASWFGGGFRIADPDPTRNFTVLTVDFINFDLMQVSDEQRSIASGRKTTAEGYSAACTLIADSNLNLKIEFFGSGDKVGAARIFELARSAGANYGPGGVNELSGIGEAALSMNDRLVFRKGGYVVTVSIWPYAADESAEHLKNVARTIAKRL